MKDKEWEDRHDNSEQCEMLAGSQQKGFDETGAHGLLWH